jgi:DNA polymerase I-like protein with 3'-5' exonuclease and polymerase domains
MRDNNPWERGRAERQAVNFKIQGSSAEQTKLAMTRFWKSDLVFKYDARFIAPIHDEVVFSVAIPDLIPFLREAHAQMVGPYADMIVPIASSISIGPNFGDQVEVGEAVNDDVINDALASIFGQKFAEAA